ncbi:MAG: 5-oxoprolinase subunit PxpA [Ekhidna sp.]
MPISIDLNADLGEHPNSNLDEQIMPYISSCNIACGGHAGNASTVRETIELAVKHNVAIGAHPSFPDRENFGRKMVKMEINELRNSLRDQMNLVISVLKEKGMKLHHVKPHGALYNYAAKDEVISKMICELVLEIDSELKLYGLAHSVTEEVANEMNVHFVGEAFADRRYEMDKTLRSRNENDAVLSSEQEVLEQVEQLVCHQRVKSDKWLPISAQTICLHSDTKGAVHLAQVIRNHLEQKGVHIRRV